MPDEIGDQVPPSSRSKFRTSAAAFHVWTRLAIRSHLRGGSAGSVFAAHFSSSSSFSSSFSSWSLPLSIARVGLPTGRREEAVEKSPRSGHARRRPGLGAVHAAPQIRTDRFPVVSLSPTSRTRLPTAPSSLVRFDSPHFELHCCREAPDHRYDERRFERDVVRFIRVVKSFFLLTKSSSRSTPERKGFLFAKKERKTPMRHLLLKVTQRK